MRNWSNEDSSSRLAVSIESVSANITNNHSVAKTRPRNRSSVRFWSITVANTQLAPLAAWASKMKRMIQYVQEKYPTAAYAMPLKATQAPSTPGQCDRFLNMLRAWIGPIPVPRPRAANRIPMPTAWASGLISSPRRASIKTSAPRQ